VERNVLPDWVGAKYEEILTRELGVPANRRPFFKKWLGEYLEFCRVRHLGAGNWKALDVFLQGLEKRGRLGFQVEQARIAVEVYWSNFEVQGNLGTGSGGIASTVQLSLGRAGLPVAGASLPPEGTKPSVGADRAREPDLPEDWKVAFASLGKEIKLRHFSAKTFKAYHHWLRAFARFVRVVPVGTLSSGHARAFIENLAVGWKVSGST
jgi:hypothetical protein